MGRRPIVRRRGRSPKFIAPSHRRPGASRYPAPTDGGEPYYKAEVMGLIHDPGRGSPLALVKAERGEFMTIAAEGSYVGQEIYIGEPTESKIGDIVKVGVVPEGTMIFNLERKPGDGGALFRAGGNYAVVVGRNPDGTITLKDSTGRLFTSDPRCLTTLGVAAGGGKIEKPFLKAGSSYKLMRSKGRLWPIVRGVAMISAYHVHGGGRHQHIGGPSSVSRRAPPGAKVGLIAPKRTGRR